MKEVMSRLLEIRSELNQYLGGKQEESKNEELKQKICRFMLEIHQLYATSKISAETSQLIKTEVLEILAEVSNDEEAIDSTREIVRSLAASGILGQKEAKLFIQRISN